jgi:peptidoglycan/xylan/chitin deacetylase (PgdA/CDA1 family)
VLGSSTRSTRNALATTRLDGLDVANIRSWLDPIRTALDSDHGPVDLFFRDDDVGWDDEGLWALLDLFAERLLPVDLAVIPRALTDRSARELMARAESGGITFHQHGFAHANHEPVGRKCEFGPSRAPWLQRRDIAEGRARLEHQLGPSLDPIFTPPWNRCTEATGGCLVELGFMVLSREARAPALGIPGLFELPVRIDWFAHRKRVLLSRTEFGELVATAIKGSGPIGLMFHHAAMDRVHRAAAAELLSLFSEHDRVNAHPMLELAGPQRPSAPGAVA